MTTYTITEEQRQELIAALESVEALIEHQYTASFGAMNCLQNASDDAQEQLGWLQSLEPVKDAPCLWAVFDESGMPEHITCDRQMAHDHINDALQEHNVTEAAKWVVRPVYTSSPLSRFVHSPDSKREAIGNIAVAEADKEIERLKAAHAKAMAEIAQLRSVVLTDNTETIVHAQKVIEGLESDIAQYKKDWHWCTAKNRELAQQLLTSIGETQGALAEVEEQARLNGMGASREAKLMAEIERLKSDLRTAEEVADAYNAERDALQAKVTELAGGANV